MRVSLNRSLVLSALCLSLVVCSAGGCRSSGTGWSTPSWLSWNNWGGSTSASPSSTALAQNKPSTTVPKPSGMVQPQNTNSVAAGTGAAGGYPGGVTNPRYAGAGAASTVHPAATSGYGTQQGYGTQSYGTQPASAYQQASATAPVGYQTGPYNTTGAAAPSGYAQGGYGQAATSGYGQQAASSAAWNTPAAPAANAGYGQNAYSSADQRGMYGAQETTSPYAADPSQQGGYSAAGGYSSGAYQGGASGYSQQPAASPYGGASAPAAPSAATGPWNNYSQPAGSYQGSTQPAAAAGSTAAAYDPSAGSYAANSQPAATSTASSYPAVPASLGTDNSSYRPGSTAGSYGVQNAGYQTQPAAGGAAAGGTYGNTYQR